MLGPSTKRYVVANIELGMAHSTDNVGNLAHPGVLMDSIDLAHYDVRQGASSSSNMNPPARQNPLQPARTAAMPCGFQTLMQSRVFTVKHVPASCQERVTATLSGAIRQYCLDPCDERLFGLLAFPKMVLRTIPTGGGQAAEHLRVAIEHRLTAYCAGDYNGLWEQAMKDNPNANSFSAPVTRGAKRQRVGGGSERIPDRTLARVRGLVAEGASKTALQLLTSTGIHDSSDPAVIQKLQELHPSPAGPLPLFAPDSSVHWEYEDTDTFWCPLIRDSILHFPRASAPGPSGLRPSHLQDALKRPGHGGTLISALALFTEMWAKGTLPGTHSPWLCGANLTPLRKPDEGVRPVAVGETLRRVVGKALLSTSVAKEQVARVQPLQVGVGLRNATEAVAMGIQSLVDSRQSTGQWVLLKMDLSNAFNCIDRETVLHETQSRCPALFNYVRYCYHLNAPLFCGGNVLASRTGVHQGCPLGPTGFAQGIHSVIERLQATGRQIRKTCT